MSEKDERNRVDVIIERFYTINSIKTRNINIKVNSNPVIDGYIIQNIDINSEKITKRNNVKIHVP